MQISVLFIGEDSALLNAGDSYLGDRDFIQVSGAKNVSEAIDLLNNSSFDLIVTDSYLPENEYCKLAEFSGEGGESRVPLLFFDAKDSIKAVKSVLDAACGLFLHKYACTKSDYSETAAGWILDILGNETKERTVSDCDEKYIHLFNMMRLMCDNVPDLIWAKDINKKYLFANRAMCDTLLKASDTSEPVGKTDRYFANREKAARPDDPDWHTFGEICLETDEITMQAEKPCQFDECGNIRGKFLFLDVHKAPFLNEDKEMIGTVGCARDVTEQRKAEEELLKSEERLRLTLEATNDGIWDWDLNSGAAILSPRWWTMLGYDPDEMPGSYNLWKSLVHPYDLNKSEEVIRNYLKKGEGYYHLEFRMKTKSDSWKWIYSRGRLVEKDKYGRPVRMVGTHTDVDKWKKAEIDLKESEHKFRTLVDRAAEMLFLHDPEGNIVDVNIKAVKRTGYSRDELLSMNVRDIDPDSDERNDNMLIWKDKPLYEDVILEVRHRCKDGSIYPAEVHAVKLLISERPFVLALATDITKRKEAEDALRRSEQKYRDVFENSAAGLFKTGADGRIIDVNDSFARMYGYSDAAELLYGNKNAFEFYINPADRRELLREISVMGNIDNLDVQQVKRDGTHFWVSINGRIIHDSYGNILYYEGSVIDISKKKQAEEALKLANRKLQILSAITRHDLLNHVTVIQGILDLIEDMEDGPEKTEYLRDVKNSALSIEDNIVFTREYEKLGINVPCWICISDIIRKLKPGNIEIKNECDGLLVYADPMLEKVFANLLDNTFRHSGGATRIKLTCPAGEEDGYIKIVWEDNGVGIPDSHKEKIFGRGVGRNTGFGLFLSREILSITGIIISETGREGSGARFELSVPPKVWQKKSLEEPE